MRDGRRDAGALIPQGGGMTDEAPVPKVEASAANPIVRHQNSAEAQGGSVSHFFRVAGDQSSYGDQRARVPGNAWSRNER